MSTRKKQSNPRKADPYAQREAEQYEHPLPSREYILDVMAEQGVPLRVEELYELLEIQDREKEMRIGTLPRHGECIRLPRASRNEVRVWKVEPFMPCRDILVTPHRARFAH